MKDNVVNRTSRRSVLRAAAAAAVTTGMIGSSHPVLASESYADEYDIVEDLGADNTGNEPINEILADAIAAIEYEVDGMADIDDITFEEDDSLKIVFPAGTYLIENGPGGNGLARWPFGVDEERRFLGTLALVGEGDVTIQIETPGRYTALTLWGRELRIEGFRLDQTPHDTSTGLTSVARDRLLVKDIHFDGKVTGDYVETPHWQDPEYDQSVIPHDPTCLIPGLLSEDGHGEIINVRVPDGVESLSRKNGCWVNFVHAGDLLFTHCEFAHLSDNAIYGSPPGLSHGGGGSVRVEESVFVNNNVTAIRLGTPGSYAKDCTVVTEPGEIPATPWGAITSRAGWVWYNFDGVYENITVIHDHPAGQGILDHGDGTSDLSLEIRDSHFELNNDRAMAVRFTDSNVEALTIDGLEVTGDSSDGTVLSLANCEIDLANLCVSQSGTNRDGISLDHVTGTIDTALLDVTGEQFVVSGGTDVMATNIHNDGDCPPDDTGRDEHLLGDEVIDPDIDVRFSNVRMREEVEFDPNGYVIGRATVTNHGEHPATTRVGVWIDFFDDFLAGDRSYEEVALDPGEATGVVFYLDDDSSSPNSNYSGVKISTLSDEHEFDIVVGDPVEDPETLGGCGPGFWRNHVEEAWSDADVFSPAFVVDGPFVLADDGFDDANNQSLSAALTGDGGSGIVGAQRILLRAAVAGLLNAQDRDIGYPRSEVDIIDSVNEVLASHHRETIIDLAETLDADNSVGC